MKFQKESNIKKEDWENWLNHWSKLRHPIVPENESIAVYKKLIKKYVKGKEVLLLGPTWQIRDMLAKMNMNVTCVDISKEILEFHKRMCKVKKRNEKIIVADWLKYSPKEKYDLVIGDAANFQFSEKNYSRFFKKVASWLKKDGVSIQLIEINNNNPKVPLKYVANYINNSKNLDNYRMKAYCYLGYHIYKNKDKYGDVASLEKDLESLVKKGIVDKKRYEKFYMHLNRFMACLLPKNKIERYMKPYLKIIERTPHGKTFVEKSFYWQYVMMRR
jgi:hypothetical protein